MTMSVHSFRFSIRTRGNNDVHDLTPDVREAISQAGIVSGVLTVFVPGSTAGITTIEYEEGAIADLKRTIERLVPSDIHYDHDARWGDGNGFSHVRAALLGPSLGIPIVSGRLQLGTWQQIILMDFDNHPRDREIIAQVVGE